MPTASGGGAGLKAGEFSIADLRKPLRGCAITATPLPDSTAAMRLVMLSCFLDDLRRTIQWRKQACNPCLVLWIVRKGESNKMLFGDLLQPDFARASRQRMRRMQGHGKRPDACNSSKTNPAKNLRRHLHDKGHVELSIFQSTQHLLR